MRPGLRKYYLECLIELPDGEIIEALMARDGLIYLLPTSCASILTLIYPHKDQGGWYFNASRDRYVAEYDADGILVNPQFVGKHCDWVVL